MTDPQYIPGTCNLGEEEVRRRLRIGYLGTALSLIMMLVIEAFHMPSGFRWLIFASVFYALSGYLQARQRFCYVYGFKGVFSVKGRKVFSRVKEDEFIRKDRRRVAILLTQITFGSLLITLAYVMIGRLF